VLQLVIHKGIAAGSKKSVDILHGKRDNNCMLMNLRHSGLITGTTGAGLRARISSLPDLHGALLLVLVLIIPTMSGVGLIA